MAEEYRQLSDSWSARVGTGAPVVLDGALGTELERRGVGTGLPLWSTQALIEVPETVEAIHREYAAAGAEVLTAGTFRTQRRSLERAGLRGARSRAAELTRLAVDLARRAASGCPRPCWVAGSLAPLEDCYRPDLVPDDAAAEAEHREHASNLAGAGVDLIAIETMNCIREARWAARAAAETGLPFWVSFVCAPDAFLLSGEKLEDALEAVADSRPDAVGVNCVPPSVVGDCLPVLTAHGPGFVLYPNLGAPTSGDGRARSEERTPAQLAEASRAWARAGAGAIGGCCGTRPDHVQAVARALAQLPPAGA